MSNVLRGTIVNPDVVRGKSAYEIAVMHGFDGTEEEWLEYLRASHKWNGTVLEITSASGTSSADLKGDKGGKGDTGNGIREIEYNGTYDLTDSYTIHFTDGTEFNFNVRNGEKGKDATVDATLSVPGAAADAKATADAILQDIAEHNRDGASHQDIRILLEEVETKLENFLDSDDVTLDELSEIITYIKSNKSLIENITSSKVNVTDIIDNLETSLPDKVLSAKQGVELKRLIDSTNTELKDALGAYIIDLAIETNALNATLGDGNLTEEEGA